MFLFFAEPVTEIIGSPDLYINTGSTINLTCLVRYAPEPPPAIVWSHDRKVTFHFQYIKSHCQIVSNSSRLGILSKVLGKGEKLMGLDAKIKLSSLK